MQHLAPVLVECVVFPAAPGSPPFQPVVLVTPRGGLEIPLQDSPAFWDMNLVPAAPDERVFRIGVTPWVAGVLRARCADGTGRVTVRAAL